MAGSTGEIVLNLMLIGKTGEGKSATGNTILGQLMFPESSETTSETKDVVSKFTRFDNYPVKVVDSPSLMDTDMDSGDDKTRAALNMATALGMCYGGVDAFIVVIKRGRFTEEQRKTLEALKKIFGDRYLHNLIVVVTGGDLFKGDMEHEGRGDISFKECCSKERGAFKQLYDDFNDRLLLINNREKDSQKNETQRREIIQLADSLRKLHGRYTSKSFEEAKAARDKLIVQENLPMLNESIQKKVGLLAADLLKLKKAPSEGERKTILQSLDDLKKEITEKDKGTGVLNHLLANVEQVKSALDDVDQLHRLAEKMENIREEKSSWARYGKIAAGLTAVAGIETVAAVVALSVAAAPVAVGVATTGLLISGTSYVLGVSKTDQSYQQHQELSKSEKQLQAEKDALDRRVTEATQDMKKKMAGSTDEIVLNLMLIGRTGEEKSATGNTILGRRMFSESPKTKDVVSKFTRFDTFPVKVVDCPGLLDTCMDSGEDKTSAVLNMSTALRMCNGGVDAFILVIRRGRFTEEQRKSLEDLRKIFGDRYMHNLIVVVTGGDKFKEDMKHEGRGHISFKECCSQELGAFKQLYDDFSDRFLLINNREKDPQKNETQRRDIIQLADSLRKLNGRYTSKSFEEAKAARDKLIVQENLPMLNESIQMKVGLLVADLLQLKETPSEGEREKILQSLDDLKKEITEKDKGTGLLKHLLANVDKVKNALHDINKLHRLAEKLEHIREAKSSWFRYGKISAGSTAVSGIGAIASTLALGAAAGPVGLVVAAAGMLALVMGYALGVKKTDTYFEERQELSKSEEQTQAKINALDRKVAEVIQDM